MKIVEIMARPAQKLKNFSELNPRAVAYQKTEKATIIKGTLTSRIEQRSNPEPYYYGFFKFPNQEQEIPVIFKTKPNLIKGSQISEPPLYIGEISITTTETTPATF